MQDFALIDRDNWGRNKDFDFFMEAGTQLHCCCDVEVGELVGYLKRQQRRFFIPVVYLIGRCLHEVDQFLIAAEHYPTEQDARVPVRFASRF